MSVALRRRRILARAKSAPRTTITALHSIESDIWLTDHDVLGHVNNARYSEFVEIALQNLLIRSGASPIIRARKWTRVTDYEAISFDRMMRFPAHFSLETRLAAWENQFFHFEHVFQSKGKVSARCQMVVHFKETSGPIMADTLLAELNCDATSPVPTDVFRMMIQELQGC